MSDEDDMELGKQEATSLRLQEVLTDALMHELLRRHVACVAAYFIFDTDTEGVFRGAANMEVVTAIRGSQPAIETLLRSLNNRFAASFLAVPQAQEE